MPFYGISIRGFGVPSPDPGDPGGDYMPSIWIRFSTVDAYLTTGEGSDPIDRVYVDCLTSDMSMGEVLSRIYSMKVEPLEGTGEFGSMECQIQIDEHDGPLSLTPGVLQAASRFLSKSNPRPWGRMFADTSAGSQMGDIDVDPLVPVEWLYFRRNPGQPDLTPGQIIYIGREALQVVSYEYPLEISSYLATQPTSVNQRLGRMSLYRGACGSRQQPHNIGPLDDIDIFVDNPVILSRDVEVYVLNDAMTEERLIFVGQLSHPTAGSKFGSIKLSAIGEMAQLNERKMGQEHAWWSWDLSARDGTTNELAPVHARATPIRPLLFSTVNGVGPAMVVVRNNAVQPVKLRLTTDRSGGMYRYQVAGVLGPIMGSHEDRKQDEDSEAAPGMVECLVAVQNYTHFARDIDGNPIRFIHPFEVIRSILTSIDGDQKNGPYDTLPHSWGAGLSADRIDDDGIDALRSPDDGWWFYADLYLENLLIESRKHTYRDVIDRILKPLLAFPSYTSEHKITIATFLDRGPRFIDAYVTDDDLIEDAPVQQEMVAYDPRVDVRYKLSRRGASNEYSGELLGSSLRGVIGKRFKAFATDEEVDCLDYGNPEVTSGTWLDDPGIRGLQALVTTRWQLANAALHKYTLTIQGDPDNLIRPGMVVSVSLPMIIHPDTGEDGVTNARCMCISASVEDETMSQTLELVNLGVTFDSQEVLAPSWYIESVVAEDFLTLSDTFEEQSGMRSFLPSSGREIWVTVFDPVTLEPLTATYGIRRMEHLVDGFCEVGGGGFLAVPTVGQIIGLAPWGSYTGSSTIDNQSYTHTADDNGELTNSSLTVSEGHKWGF